MKPTPDLSVYLITDPGLCAERGVVETVIAAASGGATIIQLRDKHSSDQALIEQGRRLRQALRGTDARLIVNDRIQVARAIGADGVHLGQSDAAVERARALLGADAIIGLSVQSVALARRVDPDLIDYVGVGPVFATATKADHARPIGFDGLARICRVSPVPTVAIGGLQLEHVRATLAAGADGLAVVSAICAAADPRSATRVLADAVEQCRRTRSPESQRPQSQ